ELVGEAERADDLLADAKRRHDHPRRDALAAALEGGPVLDRLSELDHLRELGARRHAPVLGEELDELLVSHARLREAGDRLRRLVDRGDAPPAVDDDRRDSEVMQESEVDRFHAQFQSTTNRSVSTTLAEGQTGL